jgi:arsenite-transporting ATPase
VRTFLRLLLKYREWVTSSEVAEELIKMSKNIKRVIATLTNPDECEFIAVAIPERMSLNETNRLVEGVDRLRVSLQSVLINNVIPEDAAASCDFCKGRRLSQIRQLNLFRRRFSAGVAMIVAPQLPFEIQGYRQLREYLRSWSSGRAAKGHA